jgi:outer membrane protein assembly factor BamB
MRNFLILILTISLVFSCSKDQEYDKKKAVSAFAVIDPIKVDPTLEKTPISLPKQKNNDSWLGASAIENQEVENIAKKFLLQKSKTISLKRSSVFWSFYSGNRFDHFISSPIINGDKVFILDTAAELVAYDLKADKKLWKSQVFKKGFLKNYRDPKIGYSSGMIFAVAGVNRVAAVNEQDGKVLWSKEISAIPVSAPVSDGNFVYVSTNDNKLYAFDCKSGELQWTSSGILRPTAIFGAASPILYKDLVIVSYSSGEIYAVKKKTGEALWSQDLNINKATNSDFYLNDVDATPFVKDDVIYATGNGGLMKAISAKDGNYLWKKEIAGIVDFWAAGEFLFLINNDNKLLAISKKTGGIKWISQLPNFKKEKDPSTKIIYSGVMMAGGKLLISAAAGQLIIASPIDGKIEKTYDVGKKIYHSPVVVNDKIYFYSIGKWTVDLIEIK